jgi:hypothetical protein
MLPFLARLAEFECEARDNFQLPSTLHKFGDFSRHIHEMMAHKLRGSVNERG